MGLPEKITTGEPGNRVHFCILVLSNGVLNTCPPCAIAVLSSGLAVELVVRSWSELRAESEHRRVLLPDLGLQVLHVLALGRPAHTLLPHLEQESGETTVTCQLFKI